MGQTINLTASDGFTLSAYRADPAGTPKGGIVVIQEIFGLNGHVRDVCDRFAAQGYVAIAPALFDRLKPGIELGYDEAGLKEGFGYMQQVGNDTPILDIQAAADELKKTGKVGAVGFCWGGALAWQTSKRVDVDCAVGYYGVALDKALQPPPKCPVMLHFASLDHFMPKADAEKVAEAYPDLPIYFYEADHGFNCDVRASYDEASAKQAMERTLQFFAENVG